MEATAVEPIVCPFIVAVDTNEGAPWTFQGMVDNASGRPIVVRTRYMSLGRHPVGRGDYSIVGLTDEIGIERKSIEDLIGTVLGWQTRYEKENGIPGRRERFAKEHENLAQLKCSAVIVEGTIEQVLNSVDQYGERSVAENRTAINRTFLSWQCIRHRVPWLLFASRRWAEIEAFRLLDLYWREHVPAKKRKAITKSYES